MTKQTLVLLFFICLPALCVAQNYANVDAIVSKYPNSYSKPEKLAKQISSDFKTDIDQVRAVYYWVANNVSYDYSASKKNEVSYTSKEEYQKKKEALKQKKAARVISKGRAVCDGYATLFLVLCENLDIEARFITGAAKTEVKDIGRRFNSNHAWNSVKISGDEYLIDTTWGAGYYDSSFVKEFNDFYFLTDPKLFIKKHYPDEYKDALLKEKISAIAFLDTPLFYNYDIELLHPKNGILKKGSKGRMVKFKFSTDEKVNRISYRIGSNNDVEIKEFKQDKNLEFSIYISNLTRGRELTIFINSKAIIGYKLQ